MSRHVWLLGTLFVAASLALCGAQAQAGAPAEGHGLGFQGMGARIGFVDPEGASSTVALGLHIDCGEFVKNVHIMPLAEYWKVGVSGVDVSDFTVASDVNLDFPVQGGRVTPYAGGGLGLHFVKSDDPLAPAGFQKHTDTKLGLNLQGGIKNQVMPNLGIFGEVKYAFVSNVNQLKIMGGFTYNFIY